MITLSTNVANALALATVEPFFLIKIATGFYQGTSFYRDIVMSDGLTYSADGRLARVSPPRISTSVDKEQYTISVADPGLLLGPTVENDLISKDIIVRVGFVDQTTNTPFTNLSDTVVVYSGKIESVGYTVDTNSIGNIILEVICSSPMGNLDAKAGIILSKEFMKSLNSSDVSCDQIYEGSGKLRLKWGKA